MKPLSVWTQVGLGVAGLAAGFLLQEILVQVGAHPLLITPWLALLFLLVAVFLIVFGIGVRRMKRRTKTWMTPVMAGRTALFARASAPVCATSSGVLLGIAAVGLMRSWAPMMAQSGWSALAAGSMALIAAVCAIVVERWCVDDSSDGSDENRTRNSAGRGRRASDVASARQSHIGNHGR
ncbi:DUF3180 family protein [Actinomycetaceae bacterium MB13-C1-2]|nr:DUF3180 family protein [Actinomycetaceae bacterium MB13-C1-2]